MKHMVLVVLVLLLAFSGSGLTLAQDAPSFDGVWETNGYSMVIQIADSHIDIYEVTPVSCLSFYAGPIEGSTLPELNMFLTRDGDQIAVQDSTTLYITADPLPALPDVCANGATAPTDDPELNFEVFWNTLHDNYAFFDLYDVDWQATYDTFRPQVTAETTPDELFAIFSQMLTPIHDGHTGITNGTDWFSGEISPTWFTGRAEELNTYLLSLLSNEEYTIIGDNLMIYRQLSDTVGYVMITQMAEYGDDDATAAGDAIDQVLTDLDGVQTMIIDVRFNGGGEDGVSLAIAGRFADQERLAFSKKTRDGDGWTPTREYTVQPQGSHPFTGQVIVLDSGLTASAAEIFIMAMEALPNVTVIGEPTSGAHSDILSRHLPNGWQFGLSDQVYYASDGECYEHLGMPADIDVPMNLDHFLAGQDDMLDAALALTAD